jgi:hypothetical protein
MPSQDESVPVLSADETLLRVLRNRAALVEPHTAFFIRDSERESGLSVNFGMTPDDCRKQRHFNQTYGVRSLILGAVTGLNLGVVPDQPNHANITGIPHRDDDPRTAEFLAGQLLKISTLVSEGLVKNV